MMAAQAQVYTTTTVVDASPDAAVVVQIATIPSVAVNSYGANVRFIGFVELTPGADTTAITLQIRRNTITGAQVGADVLFTATPEVGQIIPILVMGNQPTGLHSYSICLTQTDATVDATITNVGLIAIVGN